MADGNGTSGSLVTIAIIVGILLGVVGLYLAFYGLPGSVNHRTEIRVETPDLKVPTPSYAPKPAPAPAPSTP